MLSDRKSIAEKPSSETQTQQSSHNNPKNLLNRSIIVSGLIMLSRVLGLGREMLLAFHLGASVLADVLITLQHIMRLFTQLLDSINQRASVPFLVRASASEHTFFAFARGLVSIYFILSIVIALGFWWSRETLVNFLAEGFSDEGQSLLLAHWWAVCIAVPILSYLAIIEAYFASFYKLWKSYIAQLWNNGIVVFFLFWWYDNDPLVSIIGAILFGLVMAWLTSLVFAHSKSGFLLPVHRLDLNAYRPYFRQCTPAIMTSTVEFLLLFIGINILGSIADGSVAHVNYAMRLFYFPQVIIIYALNKIVMTRLTQAWNNEKNPEEFSKIMDWVIALILGIMLPAAIGLYYLGEPIVKLFYERGSFTISDSASTGLALSILAFGLPFISANTMIISSYFSRLMKFPALIIVTIGLIITSIFWWVLVLQYQMGIAGYCIGLSASYFLTFLIHCGYNLYLGHWKIQLKNILFVGKSIAATVVLYAVLHWIDGVMDAYSFGVLMRITVSICMGIVSYVITHLVLGTRMRHVWAS